MENPLVADGYPLGGAAVHGNVTLFQLGDNVNVGLNLGTMRATCAADIRKGTLQSYAASARWPLGDASETATCPNTHLSELVGSVV